MVPALFKKNNLAILVALCAVLTGIPVALAIGYQVVPDEELSRDVRYILHGFAFFLSYPMYLMGVTLIFRKPTVAMILTMGGTGLRFLGFALVAAVVMLKYRAIMKPVVMIYFISIASFLIFELVSITGLHFYARKK